MAEIEAATSEKPLDVGRAVAAVSGPEIGGVAAFVGTVRVSPSVPHGGPVVSLEYDAHSELATERLREIATAAAARWDVRKLIAVHRTGTCDVGEPTVVVACGAPHRRDALEACRWIIDEIKTTVPIWKRELYATGAAWVGAEPGS